MAYRPLSAVVLAAGEGTRMRSRRRRSSTRCAAGPMLLHVLDTLVELPLERIVVVVGHGAEQVTKTVHEQLATEMPIEFVEQRVQRGTGDAASVGLTPFADSVDAEDDVLVLTARHAAAPRRDARRPRHRAPSHRGGGDAAHGRDRRPDGLRPGRPRRPWRGRPHRRAGRRQRGGAGDHARSTRRSTASVARSSRPRCAA